VYTKERRRGEERTEKKGERSCFTSVRVLFKERQ
jgi:hypothetical protein